MTTYEYPLAGQGWELWNLHMKLCVHLGIPFGYALIQGFSVSGGTINVYCSRDLDATEKAKLDTFMADPTAGLYPTDRTGYTIFVIDDLVESWSRLQTATTNKIKFIFLDMPVKNKLEIWVEGNLTAKDKNALKAVYASLIVEKV